MHKVRMIDEQLAAPLPFSQNNLQPVKVSCNFSSIALYYPCTDAAFQSMVQVVSEEFESETITIVLKWAQGDNEFYNASIVPYVPIYYILEVQLLN